MKYACSLTQKPKKIITIMKTTYLNRSKPINSCIIMGYLSFGRPLFDFLTSSGGSTFIISATFSLTVINTT